MDLFSTFLGQVFTFATTLAVGALSYKIKFIDEHVLKGLSRLMMNVIIPLLILTVVANSGTRAELLSVWPFFAAGIIMFAVHFAYLGKFAVLSKHTGLLCCIQLISTAVFSFILFIAFEYRSFSMVVTSEVIWSVLYLALFPTGFCYFVQTWAQKRISPSGTAIILSLEGFFGSLFSVLLGLDKATPTFIIGGAIILLSVIAVQIEPRAKD